MSRRRPSSGASRRLRRAAARRRPGGRARRRGRGRRRRGAAPPRAPARGRPGRGGRCRCSSPWSSPRSASPRCTDASAPRCCGPSEASGCSPRRPSTASVTGPPGASRSTSCCASWPSRCTPRLALESVEIWTSAGPHLEQAMAVPSRPPRPLALGPEQVAALTRTSTAGPAWLELWAPDLLDGPAADAPPTRVIPAVHSDALVGLVAVRRTPGTVPVRRRRRPGPGRARTPARGRPPQPRARRRPPGHPRGPARHQRRAAGVAHAAGRHVRLRTAAHRARPARRRPAAPRRARRQRPTGPRRHRRRPRRRRRSCSTPCRPDLRTAVQEVRALAHGIYPPLLIDSGVAAALRGRGPAQPAARRGRGDVGRFAAESEAAVYFCCLEALQNAAKHAPASAVTIELRRDGPRRRRRPTAARSTSRSCDDGPGFDPATTPAGHGLQNMADRAGALGGSVELALLPRSGDHRRGLGARRVAAVSRGPERALARGAVAAVARTELRRHWARLLVRRPRRRPARLGRGGRGRRGPAHRHRLRPPGRRRPTWRTQRRRCSATRRSPTRSAPCPGSPSRRSRRCSSGA